MTVRNPGASAPQQRVTPLQKLGFLDASFLYAETANVPMNIAGLQHLDVPEDQRESFFQSLREYLVDRLHLIPFLTHRLKYTPLGIDHPVWVRDENFDIDQHVKRICVPAPGTPQQLEQLVARLHEPRLDRRRPLWEFWFIEGLEGGQCAWYTKYHHACLDGVSAQAVVELLFSETPDAPPLPISSPGGEDRDSEDPGLVALFWDAVRTASAQPRRTLSALPDLATAAWTLGERALRAEKGLGALGRSAPRTRLNAAIGPRRTCAMGTLSLSRMKALGSPLGCKVNDVFLAVCAGALARWLELRNELPRTALIAGAPVSVRAADDRKVGNQVGMLLTSLETQRPDPVERLLAIRDSAAIGREVQVELGALGLANLNVPGLPLAMSRLTRLADRLRIGDLLPMPLNVVISNVPGPRRQLWLNGAALRSHFPVSIPAHGMALNITVQSYLDRMDFGLTACPDAVPDVERLRDLMGDAFEELWLAAGMPCESTDAILRHPAARAPVPISNKEMPAPEPDRKEVAQARQRSAEVAHG